MRFLLNGERRLWKKPNAQSQMSTVLMIDIPYSMILYGGRITPAKKALALAGVCNSISKICWIYWFLRNAWTAIAIKDLPYLK
jgi:uncharacterized protein with von Willebrand factor type A (vWA) domain